MPTKTRLTHFAGNLGLWRTWLRQAGLVVASLLLLGLPAVFSNGLLSLTALAAPGRTIACVECLTPAPLPTETPTATTTATATMTPEMPTALPTATSSSTATTSESYGTPAGIPTGTPTPEETVPVPVTDTPTPASTSTLAATLTPTPSPADPLLATAIATPTPVPTEPTPIVLPPTDTPTPTPTDTEQPPNPPTPSATATPLPPDAHVLLSEIMVDPSAMRDTAGEWIELVNAGTTAANLRGWGLDDGEGPVHMIDAEIIVLPGTYVVLTRGSMEETSGYVASAYRYSNIVLANTSGELRLWSPDDSFADSFAWGNTTGISVSAGASFERAGWQTPPVWVVAQTPWSPAQVDRGSPGAPYTNAPVTATTTPVTATATPKATPTLVATAETPLPSPEPAPVVPVARLLITELMIDPQAVSDDEGEWFELFNPTTEAANLRDWTFADHGSDAHTIAADLWILPGAYLVLARNGDFATNGGVSAGYIYRGINLANSEDELVLMAPGGVEVDRVLWGNDRGLPVKAGASLERIDLQNSTTWLPATMAWPGSTGDRGSPGGPYAPPVLLPTPTATPTLPPSVTAIPSVTAVATATPGLALPSPEPLPAVWPAAAQPAALQIEEVAYAGSAEEFIALLNTGQAPLALTGWVLGDTAIPGGSEGMYALPDEATLSSGALFVAARQATAFEQRYGRMPAAEFEDTDPAVPDLRRRTDLGKGKLALNDGGDEAVLLDPAGYLADAVAFDAGNYADLGLTGALHPPAGDSLQRVPGAVFPSTPDVRQRFLAAPPQPFDARGLPLAQVHENPALDGGYMAVWGSLGSQSNFSPGASAPPHYVLAAAAAQMLDFVALADVDGFQAPVLVPPAITLLPAWRWRDGEGNAAIVYHRDAAAGLALDGLAAFLAQTQAPVQWESSTRPALTNLPAVSGDGGEVPGDLAPWFTAWRAANVPLLLGGNSNPYLPGAVVLKPRYTGFAARDASEASLLEALNAHRGWLTTRPGLWLTLRAGEDSGQMSWMGNWLPPGNVALLHVAYGDAQGEVAGLAIWQDGRPIRQLDLPLASGGWSVRVPAVPGSIIVAVATQADGDFAVTAPLMVRDTGSHKVFINELLPAPRIDANGDGAVDSNDEYIELFNPGPAPVALAGWQLADSQNGDSAGRSFTIGGGRSIGGGEWMVLWRKETRLSLDNGGEHLRLLDSQGVEVDIAGWDGGLPAGRTLSRLPDGQDWFVGADLTPGSFNTNTGRNRLPPDSPNPLAPPKTHDPDATPAATAVPTLEPSYGQAGGAPGSIAQSKLAGLTAWVEFRAVVTLPPGLFNNTIYVADVAGDGATAGIGVNVYLHQGDFPPLQEGDVVLLRGRLASFRGETELSLETPDQVWKVSSGTPLRPLPVALVDVGESLEGRLVTLTGNVSGWQGDSILLSDPLHAEAEPVRVTVRSSLDWRRPYVKKGQVWQATGVVGQFARAAPWNGGYRLLVRFEEDLVKLQ